MCFFDSPIARCERVHEMVLTDETQAECAREHGCPKNCADCPLNGYFTNASGMTEAYSFPEMKRSPASAPKKPLEHCLEY